MDENRNKTKTNRRLIVALTVCSLLAGGGTAFAAEAFPATQQGGHSKLAKQLLSPERCSIRTAIRLLVRVCLSKGRIPAV